MLLHLHNHSRQDLPAFLALSAGADTPSLLAQSALLTPHAMKWSTRVWIFDLRSCHEFWRRRAASENLAPLALIQRLLRHHFGVAEFYAAGADHPWQAALMIAALRVRKVTGLVLKTSAFGERLYRELNWSIWLAAADQLRIHMDAQLHSRKHDITCELAQLKRAVERMGLKSLRGFAGVQAASVKRRYGAMIASMWRWTHAKEGTSLDGFPWVAWCPVVRPNRLRVLDHACWDWAQIEPFLIEDLDRLCSHPAWDRSDHLTQIQWRLVFEDMEELQVEVGFRHPHHLHSEKGHHKTTVTRARERYFSVIKTWQAQRGEDVAAAALISWKLEVSAWFRVPERQNTLFTLRSSVDCHRIQSMENRLHVPLKRYVSTQDFLPEDSYQAGENSGEDISLNETWRQVASTRPLYIYQTPKAMTQVTERQGEFLERIQTKWWRTKEAQPSSRDYYRMRIGPCRRWLYRDHEGRWFEHGLFS